MWIGPHMFLVKSVSSVSVSLSVLSPTVTICVKVWRRPMKVSPHRWRLMMAELASKFLQKDLMPAWHTDPTRNCSCMYHLLSLERKLKLKLIWVCHFWFHTCRLGLNRSVYFAALTFVLGILLALLVYLFAVSNLCSVQKYCENVAAVGTATWLLLVFQCY